MNYVLAIIGLVMVFVVGDALSVWAKPESPPSWVDHLDVLLPFGQAIVWAVIKAIGGLILAITALCGIIFRHWKKERRRETKTIIDNQEIMSGKLDLLVDVMNECEGCSTAAATLKKRQERRLVLDSEDIVHLA